MDGDWGPLHCHGSSLISNISDVAATDIILPCLVNHIIYQNILILHFVILYNSPSVDIYIPNQFSQLLSLVILLKISELEHLVKYQNNQKKYKKNNFLTPSTFTATPLTNYRPNISLQFWINKNRVEPLYVDCRMNV